MRAGWATGRQVGLAPIRNGARKAVALLSADFVIGEDIGSGVAGQRQREPLSATAFGYAGEAALTYPDAAACFDAHRRAIEAVPIVAPGGCMDSVSTGLSALHPCSHMSVRNLGAAGWRSWQPLLTELVLLARRHEVPADAGCRRGRAGWRCRRCCSSSSVSALPQLADRPAGLGWRCSARIRAVRRR